MLDERNCPKYLINCKRLKDTMFTHLKRIMCFVLFLAIFTGIGIYSVEAKIAPDSITEEENIKSVIDAYFTSRYEARMEKTSDDFSSLVDETDPRSKAWLQREKDRQEVENVIADTFRTSYLSYEFTLDYEKIEVSGKDAVVDVRESNKVVYIDSPQNPSQIANLKHRITLKKVGDNWKVIDDLYEDETIKALKGMSKEEILDNIKMNYESIVHWPDQIESRSLAEAIPLADPAYDGSKALNYTYNWWNGINPTYHDAGNDCTNFASQASMRVQIIRWTRLVTTILTGTTISLPILVHFLGFK